VYDVVVLPGDGIGEEVTRAALEVIDAAAGRDTFNWKMRDCGAAYYVKTGKAMDESTREECKAADAVFLGAVGLPTVRKPDGAEITDEVVLDLRSNLDLFANVRPVKSRRGCKGPLSREDIDYIVLRENTEGLYASRTGGLILGRDVAVDSMVMTRKGVERISRYAFELARASKGSPRDGVRRVTCADKANVLRGFVFFRRVFFEVAREYPDIKAEFEHADAITVRMVLNPDTLNVIVCENMLGDILSDLGAGTIGGMGMAPAGNIGADHAMFEPVHGSAPGIAGQGIANPVAAVLSGAMMLRWLSVKKACPSLLDAGNRIESAVDLAIAEGMHTRDLGGKLSTLEMTGAIIARL
jgi:3-isopropylmalate dehydrogenase